MGLADGSFAHRIDGSYLLADVCKPLVVTLFWLEPTWGQISTFKKPRGEVIWRKKIMMWREKSNKYVQLECSFRNSDDWN